MRHALLSDSRPRPLEFYLAMEEYIAENIGEDVFFLWQTGPTVIFGRNQIAEAEVNLPYCAERGIRVVQRKSGGGCVYSDEGNIMLSYITRDTGVEKVFARYLDMVCKALNDLGLPAVSSSHNDILVGGSKVSGNAFFVLPNASIVHGTMLYNTDFTELAKAITPSQSKLAKHGVQSVRQRVGNLRDLGLTLSVEDFKTSLIERFCDSELVLGQEDIAQIERIAQQYHIIIP